MVPRRRSSAAILAAAALTVALGACGGGGGDSVPAAGPGPSSSVTAPSSPGAPSTAASAGPTPATGPLLRTKHVRARIPAGWHLSRQQATFMKTGFDDKSEEIDVGEFPTIGTSSLRSLSRTFIKENFDGKGTILPPVTINGVQYAHVRGRSYTFVVDDYETYAVADLSQVAGVTFSLKPSQPEAQRQAIIDQVLATLEISP